MPFPTVAAYGFFMSIVKKEVLAAIEALPDDVNIAAIIRRIQQIHRIRQGIEERRARAAVASQSALSEPEVRRRVPEALRGTLLIHGDLVASAFEERGPGTVLRF